MQQAAEVAMALQLASRALQFYSPEHPRVAEAIATLESTCEPLLATKPRLTFTVANGGLLFDGDPILHPPPQVKTLVSELEKRQIGGFLILAGVTRSELLQFVRLLTMRPEAIKSAGGADKIIKSNDIVHVRLSHVRYEAVTEQEDIVWTKSTKKPDDNFGALPSLLQSIAAGEAGDIDLEEARAMIAPIVTNEAQLALLRTRLDDLGMENSEFDRLLDVLGWDALPVDARIEKLATGDRIFEIATEKFQHFVRSLIDSGRAADAHRLFERYVTGLSSESVAVRQNVCDALGQIVAFNLPGPSEQLVGTAILNEFVRETNPRARVIASAAAANLLSTLIASDRCEAALRVIEKLDATSPSARDELTEALAERARITPLIARIGSADADAFARHIMPLTARLGSAVAPHVIEALATDEDRQRRGRYMKALKAIGEPAFPFLLDALRSPTWYIVRNTLNVLGDIGTTEQVDAIAPTLGHTDARVRRAAARALGKIGGESAESLLVGAMNDRDFETQSEVLLCLGSMKARSAVPGLTELVRTKRLTVDGRIRELALGALGQIGAEEAVAVLGDILRPRNLFTRDTPQIRIAAAKALAAISTPTAKEMLRSVVNAESDGAMRAAMAKLVS